ENSALMNFISFTNMDSYEAYRASYRGGVLYPHRQYDPVSPFQFSHISVRYSLNRIAKIFVDFVKPYKSGAQVLSDFKQPVLGLWNILRGLIKTIGSIFVFDNHMLTDGLFTLVRGLFEVVMTPITWFLKPLVRGIVTGIAGKPLIENNSGMEK